MFEDIYYYIINKIQAISDIAFAAIMAFLFIAILWTITRFLKDNSKITSFKLGKLVIIIFFILLAVFLVYAR